MQVTSVAARIGDVGDWTLTNKGGSVIYYSSSNLVTPVKAGGSVSIGETVSLNGPVWVVTDVGQSSEALYRDAKGVVPGVSIKTMGQSIGMIGNSIALNGWNTNAGQLAASNSCRAILAWVMLFSKGRLKLSMGSNGRGYSASVGGITSDQILSDHLPTALSSGWDFCIVLCPGTNDGIDFTPNAWKTTRKNVIDICSRLVSQGITPVLTTECPKGSGQVGALGFSQYHLWLRQYAEANGFILADLFGTLVAPATQGEFKAGVNTDTLHPNEPGAKLLGAAIWNAIAPVVSLTTVPLPQTNLQGGSEPVNLMARAMNADGSNALLINSAANVATGLGTQGTGTFDIATASSSGFGNIQKQTTTTAGQVRSYAGANNTGALIPGNRMLFVCEAISNVKGVVGQASILVMDGALSVPVVGLQSWTEDIPVDSVIAMEYVQPAGVATMRAKCEATAAIGSMVGWGRLGLFDLTALEVV